MLELTLVPMLTAQRCLYEIPRGPVRFRSYLDVLTGGTDDIVRPLSTFNPMGGGHVADRLDELIRLDAESRGRDAIEEAVARLAGFDASFCLGLVLADDAGGGWTSRPHVEIENRFRPSALLKRGWVVALSWTTEEPSAHGIRESVLKAIYRTIAIVRAGEPRTLDRMMAREGFAAAFAGQSDPALDGEELAYTREVIRPHRDATDLATIIPCLFGDRAAQTRGNEAFGLSDRAGFALALAEAREAGVTPEAALLGDRPQVVSS